MRVRVDAIRLSRESANSTLFHLDANLNEHVSASPNGRSQVTLEVLQYPFQFYKVVILQHSVREEVYPT